MSDLKTRAPRTDIDLPVSLSFENSNDRLFGTSKNISTTGMLVLAKESGQPGTRVSFESVPASGVGEVVWSRMDDGGENWIGLRIVELARGDRHFFPSEPEAPHRNRWRQASQGRSGGDLDFRRLTDFLVQQDTSLAEIAFTLGTSVDSIQRARRLQGSEGNSELPEGWRDEIAAFLQGKGDRLEELGRRLTGE